MKLYIVGTGPGAVEEMTLLARKVIENCEVVVGYSLYIDLIRSLLHGKKIISTGMTGEVERCNAAINEALEGKTVCVISGGDAGVYGMAGLVHELAAQHPELDIEVIPGVTAACSAAAVLGAPLTHDFAAISLSDRLTDWEIITKRLHMAAQADFVITLYNPASKARRNHLKKACEIIMQHRPAQTPCGIVRNIGRDGELSTILKLDELAVFEADMFTTAIIGNSRTQIINGRLVTPRGYNLAKPESYSRFPLFISLENKAVLVVGGGKVAARRTRVLIDFGASVTVVSPELNTQMREHIGHVTWKKQRFDCIDKNFALVLAATDDRNVNKQIGECAKALGIPVSVADRKEESTFWFPAIAKGDGIVGGLISESGNHGAVKEAAKKVRNVLTSAEGHSSNTGSVDIPTQELCPHNDMESDYE